MQQLENAAFALLHEWPEEDGNTVIPNLYPFKQSFNELCHEITTWREDCQQYEEKGT